jgi:hypothetical protein
MIPRTVSDQVLERAIHTALTEQLATHAGSLNTNWGSIYRELDNERLRRAGLTEWPEPRTR